MANPWHFVTKPMVLTIGSLNILFGSLASWASKIEKIGCMLYVIWWGEQGYDFAQLFLLEMQGEKL